MFDDKRKLKRKLANYAQTANLAQTSVRKLSLLAVLSVGAAPFAGLSIHAGRHRRACSTKAAQVDPLRAADLS